MEDNQLFKALRDHLDKLVRRGFAEKHFAFTVTFKPESSGKTSVNITGGPSKRFVVRDSEVPR